MKWYPQIMDNREIRRINLLGLIGRFKTIKEFAEAADMDPSHVSQLKSKHGNIGSNVARKLETKFYKQPGWMDVLDQTRSAATVADLDSPELYLASIQEDPLNIVDNSLNLDAHIRLIKIINKAIGEKAFSAAARENQVKLIRYCIQLIKDQEVGELSDDAIAKLLRMQNEPG